MIGAGVGTGSEAVIARGGVVVPTGNCGGVNWLNDVSDPSANCRHLAAVGIADSPAYGGFRASGRIVPTAADGTQAPRGFVLQASTDAAVRAAAILRTAGDSAVIIAIRVLIATTDGRIITGAD